MGHPGLNTILLIKITLSLKNKNATQNATLAHKKKDRFFNLRKLALPVSDLSYKLINLKVLQL